MLLTLAILLATAVLMVSLSRRLGFGSVLGYLVGGALIGPSGLRLITGVDEIASVSELGIVMLLFLIGLEVRPQRLWVMRRAVFGLGTAQVVVTGAALAAAAHGFGAAWPAATVLGAGLALSSTAIVLPMLAERNLLGQRSGRDIFSVLLFQDLAFIPIVAAVPLLAGGSHPDRLPWLEVGEAVAAIAIILVGGRFLIRPAFRAIGGARTPELFIALALFVVAGTATLASVAGLSTSLGAFLGGVLLSNSEYRHEVQADVEPFEGLLLGFFFLSVGMSANLPLALQEPWFFAAVVPGLMLVKAAIAFPLSRIAGQSNRAAIRFALALPQGSEFSFVLFSAAIAAGALTQAASDRATLAIALSMAATPLLFAASERLLIPRLETRPPPAYDAIRDDGAPVIICGFGRVGQIVGRILRMRGIPFTALEQNSEQVEVVRRFGSKVYYGNPSRPDLLRAAGAEHARLLVVALDDPEETLKVVDIARRNFPNLKLLVRARNRRHAHLLMDRGVTRLVRETFGSSLRMSEMALEDLGVPADEAERAVELFRDYDERSLVESRAYHDDERQLIQSAKQAADELAGLFEADQRSASRHGPPSEASGRLEREQPLHHQRLGDLHGVQRRALAKVVRDAPEGQAVLDGGILADAADEHRVLAGALGRGDVAAVLAGIHHRHPRRLAQHGTRVGGGDGTLELDGDRLGVADEHRDAHTGGDHLDVRVEDLAGLDHHLPLLLGRPVLHELVDVGDAVEGDLLGELLRLDRVVDEARLGLAEQLVHALLAGARNGLVGGDHHATDLEAVVQRLQRDHHLDGAAIRVGDDFPPGEAREVLRIDLRHHQRDVRLHAELAGVVDHHAARRRRARRVDR